MARWRLVSGQVPNPLASASDVREPDMHDEHHDNDHGVDDNDYVDDEDGDMDDTDNDENNDDVNHSDLGREEAETVAVQETADHRLKVSLRQNLWKDNWKKGHYGVPEKHLFQNQIGKIRHAWKIVFWNTLRDTFI